MNELTIIFGGVVVFFIVVCFVIGLARMDSKASKRKADDEEWRESQESIKKQMGDHEKERRERENSHEKIEATDTQLEWEEAVKSYPVGGNLNYLGISMTVTSSHEGYYSTRHYRLIGSREHWATRPIVAEYVDKTGRIQSRTFTTRDITNIKK
jgi:hypothetical protein